jgi:hypothetical protein
MPFYDRLSTSPRPSRGCFRLRRPLAALVRLALIAQVTISAPATATVRIADDRGGNIGDYWSRFTALRDAKEQVVIDGICSSACTMVLGIVPRDRICVTDNATLGFHAAYRPGFLGSRVVNEPATRTLMGIYPDAIRQWLARNGGLSTETVYLSGPELFALYRKCR